MSNLNKYVRCFLYSVANSVQLGEMVVVDLKPNGRNIPVTDENKDEYIQLIAEYRLTTSIKQQLDSFLEGFYEVVPKEHIVVVCLPYEEGRHLILFVSLMRRSSSY